MEHFEKPVIAIIMWVERDILTDSPGVSCNPETYCNSESYIELPEICAKVNS